MKPVLIATFGYAGSGKTYFTERLAHDLHLAHLRSDDIRFRMYEHPTFGPKEHDAVFDLIDFLAGKFLSNGVGVAYDANLVKKKHRDRVRKIAEASGSRFVLLSIETPFEVAVARAKKRTSHSIERSTVESLRDESESLDGEAYVTIDGMKTYEEQRESILEQINNP